MPIAYNFEKERQFLKDSRNAITFKPFEVKDEFKEKYKQSPEGKVIVTDMDLIGLSNTNS